MKKALSSAHVLLIRLLVYTAGGGCPCPFFLGILILSIHSMFAAANEHEIAIQWNAGRNARRYLREDPSHEPFAQYTQREQDSPNSCYSCRLISIPSLLFSRKAYLAANDRIVKGPNSRLINVTSEPFDIPLISTILTRGSKA